MTTVVFLRHGYSVGNLRAVFQGQLDFPLTEQGRAQARRAAEYLDKYRFDRIYTSDLSRASETAETVAGRQNAEVIPCPAFREIFAGKWEGMTYTEIAERYPAPYKVWKEDFGNAAPTDGDTVAETAKRIYEAFDRISSENEGKKILIVTHAVPIRLLMCRFAGRPVEFAAAVPWVPNASVTAVTSENGTITYLENGYDAFIYDLHTAFPSNV